MRRPPDLPGRRGIHLVMMVIYLAPWVLGLVMEADRERATLFGVEGPRCPSRYVAPDLGCPGCGLTRATVLALHGECRASWEVNPVSWLVLALGLTGALLRGDILLRNRMTSLHLAASRWGPLAFALALGVAYGLHVIAVL